MKTIRLFVTAMALAALGGCGASYDLRVHNSTDLPVAVRVGPGPRDGETYHWLRAVIAPRGVLLCRINQHDRGDLQDAVGISASPDAPPDAWRWMPFDNRSRTDLRIITSPDSVTPTWELPRH